MEDYSNITYNENPSIWRRVVPGVTIDTMKFLFYVILWKHQKHEQFSSCFFRPCINILIYRVSQEECARLREGVPCVKLYRYNPKHLCPKLNCYGDNDQRKVWSSGGSTQCTCQLEVFSTLRRWVWYHITAIQLAPALTQIPIVYMSFNNVGHIITSTITALQHFAIIYHTATLYHM